ncbi:hypothetical protein [Salinicola peritrichatus]|uniref:hypothetical protein n=1 Tax=Salinicola peritrichatus TaxID=1267424 RepID=UPI000DA15FE5|nr:hypothetical protein [Salinicola peritrichatus]
MHSKSTTHTVTLARTGTQQEVTAETWRDALRVVGQPDACVVEHTGERSCRISFDPEDPQILEVRTRDGELSEVVRWGLDNVVHHLDMAISLQEVRA